MNDNVRTQITLMRFDLEMFVFSRLFHWTPRYMWCSKFGSRRYFGITITSFPPVVVNSLGLQLRSDIKLTTSSAVMSTVSTPLVSYCGFTNPNASGKETASIPACHYYRMRSTSSVINGTPPSNGACYYCVLSLSALDRLYTTTPVLRIDSHHGAPQICGIIGQAPLPLDINHCDHGLLTIWI